jgi:hypothetical protein
VTSATTAQQVIWLLLAFSVSSAILTAWFADRKGLSVAWWALAGLALFVLALAAVIAVASAREPGERSGAPAAAAGRRARRGSRRDHLRPAVQTEHEPK